MHFTEVDKYQLLVQLIYRNSSDNHFYHMQSKVYFNIAGHSEEAWLLLFLYHEFLLGWGSNTYFLIIFLS